MHLAQPIDDCEKRNLEHLAFSEELPATVEPSPDNRYRSTYKTTCLMLTRRG